MEALRARLLSDANVASVNARIVGSVRRSHRVDVLPQRPAAVRSIVLRELSLWNDERGMPAEDAPVGFAAVVEHINARAVRYAELQVVSNYLARAQLRRDQREDGRLTVLPHAEFASSVGEDIRENPDIGL